MRNDVGLMMYQRRRDDQPGPRSAAYQICAYLVHSSPTDWPADQEKVVLIISTV